MRNKSEGDLILRDNSKLTIKNSFNEINIGEDVIIRDIDGHDILYEKHKKSILINIDYHV